MAETSKNKIYYNDNENSVADVLADMKKMAESTDEAIEKSKYNDAAIKKSISDVEKKQVEKNTEQDSKIVELQTEKAKLEKELKEMQEDFYQNSIRGQASGEYIHVEDSSNCRAKIGIGGNHEQETSTQTENYVDDREARGKTISQATSLYLPIVNLKAGDNYYLKIFDKDNQLLQDSRYLAVEFYDANKTKIQDGPLGFPKSFTEEAVTKIKYAKIYYNGNDTDKAIGSAVIKKIGLKITSNASADDIDLFVPNMPSTDYPSSIVAVGSNVNIFEATEKSFYSSESGKYVEYLKDTNEYHITSTQTWYRYTLNNLKIGKEYTLSFEAKSSTVNSQMNGFLRIDKISDGAILKAFDTSVLTSAEYKRYSLTFIPTENSLYINIRNTNGIDAYIKNIKLVEGTETGEYSKYGQGCVKVTKCNKNLAIKNVKGYFSISDFKIKIDNNSEAFLFYAEKGKEYTRSCKVNLDRNRIGKIDTLDVTQGMTVLNGQEINSNKFICDDSGIYIWFVNSTLNDSIKESFQIEEGSTESTFEQHEEQSYIMPVQKEMLQGDYFDFDNEEEVHVWGKVVLSGAETIVAFSLTDTRSVFYVKIDGMYVYKDKNSIPVLISDEFKVKKQIETWKVGDISRIIERPEYVALILAAGYTLDTFKELLATNKPKVYYKLAEPIRLKFTDEQKAVAKELNNARTYKNVTNITTDSKAILSLDYAKDLETLLNNTQALAVNNASEGV